MGPAGRPPHPVRRAPRPATLVCPPTPADRVSAAAPAAPTDLSRARGGDCDAGLSPPNSRQPRYDDYERKRPHLTIIIVLFVCTLFRTPVFSPTLICRLLMSRSACGSSALKVRHPNLLHHSLSYPSPHNSILLFHHIITSVVIATMPVDAVVRINK